METLTEGDLPPNTPQDITPIARATGFDPDIRDAGNHPVRPADNRSLLLGTHVKYCIVVAQCICPIYTKRLLKPHDLTDIDNLFASLHRLHFDHFMPRLKHTDAGKKGKYKTELYWYMEPRCLLITPEKDSGYFVHDRYHQCR